MELIKICPTCQTGNEPIELLCTRCFGDISGVKPVTPPMQKPESAEESSATPMHLILSDGRRIEIRSGDIAGRAGTGGELFREYAAVSRNHARFDYIEGGWQVTDLNSSNGTWLEGKRLPPETPVHLKNGQEIRLASSFRAAVMIDGQALIAM